MADTGLIPMIPPGIYRHSKSRRFYLVTGVAKDAADDTITTQNLRVNYTALYGDFNQYHRTLDDFIARVPKPDDPDSTIPRFEFVCEYPPMLPQDILEMLEKTAPILWNELSMS